MISSRVGVVHVPPPQADPELAKARRQLADWETCPSRTTSAGQAKIKQYSAQVDELAARDTKAQLDASNQPSETTRAATNGANSSGASSGASSAAPRAGDQGSTVAWNALGARVDIYA